MPSHRQFKVIVVGDSGVGKTSFIVRFSEGRFVNVHDSTVGVDCKKVLVEAQGSRVELHLWDTAGQERFRSIVSRFYRSADGAIVMYDVTKQSTFDNVPWWVEDVSRACPNIPVVLVGNKNDGARQVEVLEELAHDFAEANRLYLYQSSARDNVMVAEQGFRDVAKGIEAWTPAHPEILIHLAAHPVQAVGKSALLLRYVENYFAENLDMTIGVDYRSSMSRTREQAVKLMIWDTAGQEKFHSITKSFYHGAHGALIVYDTTNRDSFLNIHTWLRDLRRIKGDIPVIIVGNKTDIHRPDEEDMNEADIFAEEHGLRHMLVSARTGNNVKEAFLALTHLMMDLHVAKEVPLQKVQIQEKEIRRSSCCC